VALFSNSKMTMLMMSCSRRRCEATGLESRWVDECRSGVLQTNGYSRWCGHCGK